MNPETQCDVCHIGTRRERQTSYIYWLDGTLVIMPNTTIWVCDVCDDVVFDEEQIAQLEMLLGVQIDAVHTVERHGKVQSANQGVPPSRRRSV